ncbi:hypothetical protein GCM10029978_040590 [Actinoallomurus acanthiterrae]
MTEQAGPGGVGVGVGAPAVRPKNWTAAAAMPLIGRLWPAAETLIASTGTAPDESAKRCRVQPGWGVSVEVGVVVFR